MIILFIIAGIALALTLRNIMEMDINPFLTIGVGFGGGIIGFIGWKLLAVIFGALLGLLLSAVGVAVIIAILQNKVRR